MGKQRDGGGRNDKAKTSVAQYRKKLGSREKHQLRYSQSKSLRTKEIPDFEPKQYLQHVKVAGTALFTALCVAVLFYFVGGMDYVQLLLRRLKTMNS